MDRFNNIILVAGLACFVFAFLLSGLYPWLITDARDKEATIEEVAKPVTSEFKELKNAYPVAFAMAFDNASECLSDRELALQGIGMDDPRHAASEAAWAKAHAKSLRDGRDLYIGEACWHCHSQYVRPVANEELRFGPVQTTRHDNNALQRPVLWGTRRVGPDLTHEGGKRSNDWHMAHLLNPQSTTPGSIMPRYGWYFREGFQVRRHISEETAEMEGVSKTISHPYPGVYTTKAEAEKVMADLQENPPPNLDEEVERCFVAEGRGPAPEALYLVSYLQWLGTWDPDAREEASR